MHVYGTQKYCNFRLYTYIKLQQKHVHVHVGSSILPCTPEGLAEIRDRAKAKRRQEEGVSMEECPDKEAEVRGEVCVVVVQRFLCTSYRTHTHFVAHTSSCMCTHLIVHCMHTSCCRHVHFVAHI